MNGYTCTCSPAPNITWKKNGQQIVPGQNSFEIPSHYYGRRLTITNVNKTIHQDVYTCEAANSLSNGQPPLTRTINLEVKGIHRFCYACTFSYGSSITWTFIWMICSWKRIEKLKNLHRLNHFARHNQQERMKDQLEHSIAFIWKVVLILQRVHTQTSNPL